METNLVATPEAFDQPSSELDTASALIRPPQPLPFPVPTPLPVPGPGPVVTSPCEPVLSAINPTQGQVLSTLTLIGNQFTPMNAQCSPDVGPVRVSFADSHPGGAIAAQVLSANDTQIMVTVPDGAKTSAVTVTNTKGQRSTSTVAYIVMPTISDIAPQRGGAGASVTVFGTALYNTPQFFFSSAEGDVPANFSVPAPNVRDRIQIAVPAGLVPGRAYKIKVITKGGGTARSAVDFMVAADTPQVGDYMPKQGAPGTAVTIKAVAGTVFQGITSVSFLTNPDAIGRARRIFLKPGEFSVSGNRTSIQCLVPEGAVTGKIRISNEVGSGATGQFRVPLATPAALAARAQGPQAIDLSWRDTTTTESGFKLERAFGAQGSELDFQLLATLSKDRTAYTDTQAPAQQVVRYRLKSFNAIEGESSPSNLVVATAGGHLQLNPIRLQFTALREGVNPPAQTLLIERNPTEGSPQAWTASSNASWLRVQPLSGTTPAAAGVSVDVFGLKSGRYTGVVVVSTPNADAAISVTVELLVTPPAGAIVVQVVGAEEAS